MVGLLTGTDHHNSFTALLRDHPGEPVPEENFWTLWCKGRLTEADTLGDFIFPLKPSFKLKF